ncbi:(d)CMP kinase [Halalkalibacterium ligniniphilum]|uniref:(d)CMP kinase n=1 Tax=Halalkalibacterium ligniniphilum TaxID=1134413 RepID=UPI0003498895|nr:(d)CMP kinase [Halalkalibacterium ligniniphilum]
MKGNMNIAIDGPAGAGKSTVAKKVAKALSYLYIDTGAMYRALTYAALKKGIDLNNGRALLELLEAVSIKLEDGENDTKVYVNDEEVTASIRTDQVTKHVSLVASHREVREKMVEQQQRLASQGGAVLDGRDIGTFVLPNAELKVFLTASVEERAKRRYEENRSKGFSSDLEQLKVDIVKRDELDSNRAFAPLRKAEDAVEIDTTSLSIDEVSEAIITLAKERA